ncbi:MAG: peptidase S8/S53 domain-containing protein [Benniella sp.]|nr:MAG: peptidase S8/S53 domain-containing protein [Benniella sp.]
MKITSFLSLVAAATLVSAGQFIPTGQGPDTIDFVPGAFIIEFQDGFDYTKSGIFLNVKIGLSFDISYQYSIFNGMSIEVKSGHTGDDLAAMEGVKRVWPVRLTQIPKQEPSNEDMVQSYLVKAHDMTGVKYVQDVLGLTGKGTKVGVIDTGVDYKHPAFGGCPGKPGPGCRVAFGRDFIGENFDETGKAVEDDDPMDQCNGHGTHVAGIIGADARNIGAPQPFVGVAPEVTLGAYKIFSCTGAGRDDVTMNAMEYAVKTDKMDIINMSIANGSAFRSNPIAALADKLTEMGVVVVGSAGNSGADGVWSVADTGLGAFSTSVASFENIASDYYYFTYNGKEYPYIFSDAWGKPLDLPPSTTLIPVLKSDGSLSDGCTADSYAAHDVKGKIVLVYGDNLCKSGVRGEAAKIVGAAGIFIRAVPYGFDLLGGNDGFPMASIEARTSEELIAAYRGNNDNAFQWSTVKKSFSTEGAGAPSDFSAWGFDGDLHIKPDISAPGGKILSTYPQDMGSYHVESGTSMSSPYVAGAYALLFQMTKPLPASDIRQRFINSAIPGMFFNHTKPAPVAKQGSGLINVKNTFAAKSYFSTTRFPTTDRIELLDTVRFAGNIDVNITNVGEADTNYTLSHEPAESAISYRGGNTSPFGTPLLEDDEAVVAFSKSIVTVPAGQSVTINLQFQEPSSGLASEFPFYSGYIVATPQVQDAAPLRLPYAGIKGDISQVPMLDTNAGFPKFAVFINATKEMKPVEAGHKIDWNTEQPLVQTRLGSHTPELSIRLHDEAGNFVGYWDTPTGIAASQYGRDPGPTAGDEHTFRRTDWRGGKIYTDRNATASDAATGKKYRIVVAAQRKFSKGVYPEDFEVHEVAVIML